MAELITGLFHDRDQAEQAVTDLQALGYSPDDISVMMNDAGQARDFAGDTGTKAAEGAGVGAGIGGTLGAIIAALTATGSVAAIAATGGLAAPLVAGPLAAALAGAGAGGLAGGIIGGLVGAGIPEDRAQYYEQGLNAGGILIGVTADEVNIPEIRRVLERDGADDVQGRYDTAGGHLGNTASQTDFLDTTPAATAAPPVGTVPRIVGDAPRRIQLREEELRASTHEVPTGEVRVHKDIITETRSIDVPVTREEVVIERRPVGASYAGADAFDETAREIRVPVMEEQVTVEKVPVVTEEVEIGTRRVTETQHLTGTVQREELRVDEAKPGGL